MESALIKKGFQADQGDHHWFIYYTRDGQRTTVKTKTSHGSTRDLGDSLLGQMARQIRISKALFLDLIDCPLAQDEYEKLLRNGDHV